MDAVGLLAYFLSLPPDWKVHKTTLHNSLNLGREKLDRIFKELQQSGYILTTEKRDCTGRVSYDHAIYDKPQTGEPLTEKPLTGKPYTGKPSTVNPHLLSKDIQSTELQSTNKQSKKDKDLIFFETFWTLYPKKVGKEQAKKLFCKLPEQIQQQIIEHARWYKDYMQFPGWQHPNPTTYLNQKRYNDKKEDMPVEKKQTEWRHPIADPLEHIDYNKNKF